MQTPESLSSFNECPRPSSLAQPSLTAYECVVESRNASPNLMAGTILASSPHYFSAVEDYHACLMKNWLALATLRSKQNLPQSHCLYEQTNFVQPAYVEKIRYSFYANRLVTSMYWVVKWATLRKPKLIRIGWPTGCPNRARMKDPSLHEPSKKVLPH